MKATSQQREYFMRLRSRTENKKEFLPTSK